MKTTTRELEDMEYDVSLLGGYSDEEEISQDITEMLLVVMQVVMKMDAIGCHPIWMVRVTKMDAAWCGCTKNIQIGHLDDPCS